MYRKLHSFDDGSPIVGLCLVECFQFCLPHWDSVGFVGVGIKAFVAMANKLAPIMKSQRAICAARNMAFSRLRRGVVKTVLITRALAIIVARLKMNTKQFSAMLCSRRGPCSGKELNLLSLKSEAFFCVLLVPLYSLAI
ncbi:PREDICTED: uncharacterized protein LOC107338981 [Acropora digitifera]|uniref:uncharacterized protein LOC107338981 n=1 Tax=Acropora digitifera TaxID=70779 RepID=UPI00077AE9A0|nr:PREDICTED: uncharacterized protein LOC107338981 [Acropora digitifera]